MSIFSETPGVYSNHSKISILTEFVNLYISGEHRLQFFKSVSLEYTQTR